MIYFKIILTKVPWIIIPCYLPPLPQAWRSREAGKSPSSLGLADFDLLRVIGRGSYAKVLLVRLKKTERIYAMKVVKKELVNDDEVSDAGAIKRTRFRCPTISERKGEKIYTNGVVITTALGSWLWSTCLLEHNLGNSCKHKFPNQICHGAARIVSSFLSDTPGVYKETKTGDVEKYFLTRLTKKTGILTRREANETPQKVFPPPKLP